MLARAQEIEGLEKQLKAQQLIQGELQSALDLANANYQAALKAADQARLSADQAVQEAHTFEVEQMQLAQAKEQYSTRAAQIDLELTEIRELTTSINTNASQAKDQLKNAESEKVNHEKQLAEAQTSVEQANRVREALRESLRAAEMTAQEAAFNTRSLQQKINDLQRDQTTARTQIMELQDRFDANQTELKTLSDEAAKNKLQSLLVTRSEREAALAKARTEQEAMQHQLREADEARLMLEQTLQPMRDRVVDLQLREQAARLSYEQFTNLLSEDEADLQALSERYNPDLRASSLQGEVTRLNNEIQ
jgi:chromosome segregation protein